MKTTIEEITEIAVEYVYIISQDERMRSIAEKITCAFLIQDLLRMRQDDIRSEMNKTKKQ